MRLVCISDTHGRHNQIRVPEGDVLIHAGDFTNNGKVDQVADFAEWLDKQPHAHKIAIPGNHDFLCERAPDIAKGIFEQTRIRYLVDQTAVIDGVIFYGSPWQPRFCDWAFNLDRGAALRAKWDLIPNGVNVLITHGPPQKFLDRTAGGEHVGCEDLARVISKRLVDLSMSVFGHIHEGYGYYRNDGPLFVNSSTCSLKYQPINQPIVVDLVDGIATVVVTGPVVANG